MGSSLLSSYLASGMRKSAFYPADFGDSSARVARVRAAVRPLDSRLVDALWSPHQANLTALREGAAAVVTGQQIGLYLGPLYTFYKAATAVVAARRLGEEAGVRCVPIFWLQTEDHDFAEIAGCRVGDTTLSLPLDDRRCSVSQRTLGDQVRQLETSLCEAIAGEPHADEVLSRIGAAYQPGATLSRAFSTLLSGFFPELVFCDPRHPTIAALALPTLRRAIDEAPEIERLLAAQGEVLRAAGFDEQVAPRAGQTLVFHHRGADGPRERIPIGRGVEAAPLELSSSALLRPLMQDALLPTAAYVGGPAEVAYFAQLPPLYRHFGITPPMVIPRARFRLVPPAASRLLSQLGVTAAATETDLAARLAPGDPSAPSRAWLSELEARLDGYAPHAPKDTERARASLRHAIDRLARRHQHHAKRRADTVAGRVARLQKWLFPDGQPQERVHGVAWYAAHTGPAALAARVRDAIDLFDPSVKDLTL
jgi:bacillithiol synthase